MGPLRSNHLVLPPEIPPKGRDVDRYIMGRMVLKQPESAAWPMGSMADFVERCLNIVADRAR